MYKVNVLKHTWNNTNLSKKQYKREEVLTTIEYTQLLAMKEKYVSFFPFVKNQSLFAFYKVQEVSSVNLIFMI